MRKVILGSGLLAACVAGSANAAFIGWGANVSQDGELGIIDVYATFDGGGHDNRMLNVFSLNMSTIGFTDFWHNDFTSPPGGGAGVWQPQAGVNAMDSYVTIGHEPGFANPTAGDPSFQSGNWSTVGTAAPFATDGGLPGWYNGNPGNPVLPVLMEVNGVETWAVLVGRFITVNPQDGNFRSIVFDGWAGWGNGLNPTLDSKTFTYINVPTPGALALVGLAGLVGRRRRA